MKGSGSKNVWILRGDLESKHQSLESKIPQNPLNIKFILDNWEIIKILNFWEMIDCKSEKKPEITRLKIKANKNSIQDCKISHSS